MNKEEIEKLKDFTIDITDIDELALGLEVCSKKSNMVIQEFANLIIELEQQNKKYKEVIDRAIDYLEDEIKRINPKELDIGELNLRLNDIKFTQYLIYKEILQKYKSIIGGKE